MRTSTPCRAAFVLTALLAIVPRSARADGPAEPTDAASTKSVRFDSTKAATVLEKLTGAQDQQVLSLPAYGIEQSTWLPFCVTPCEAKVDLDAVYRVEPINGATASGRFTLPRDVKAVHLDPGNAGVHLAGGVALLVGIIAFASGGSTAIAASDNPTRNAGLVIGGAGLVGVLIGIPLLLVSRTDVHFE